MSTYPVTAQVIDSTSQINYDSLYSQERLLSDTIPQSVLTQSQDSLVKDKTLGTEDDNTQDNAKVKEEEKEKGGYGIFSMFQGNPGKAGLYSLIVPGLGQAYNKRWWKIPIAVGAEATVIYILINNISEWNRRNEDYLIALDTGVSVINPNIDLNGARNIRNTARQNKDYAWIGLFAVHLIVAADAFVDRHLIEFDVDDDLSIKASPLAPYPGINVVMTF